MHIVLILVHNGRMMPNMPSGRNTATQGSRWGPERRLEFIDFRLRWDGRLNRADLISFFGISVPQASLDIAKYTELAPNNLVYDRRAKVYVAGKPFEPLFPGTTPSRYLNELLAAESGLLPGEASFLGWKPPIGFVPSPGRALAADMLSALLTAVREQRGLRVRYQSMSRPEPTQRELTPHAFGHDGFRWHVRAYCHIRAEFRDFVIARMTNARPAEPCGPGAVGDTAWNTLVPIVLIPNPRLPQSHQRAVEVDFGMLNGEARLDCRRALVFYVLRHLGLLVDSPRHPEAQQVVLKDRTQIVQYLPQIRDER